MKASFWLLTLLVLLLCEVSRLAEYERHGSFLISDFRLYVACMLIFVHGVCVWYAIKRKNPFLPSAKKMWGLFGMACLCCCVCNLPMYLPKAHVYVPVYSAMGMMCVLWAVAGRFSLVFWIPFWFLEILLTGVYWQFGILLNNDVMIAEIIDASYSDVMALFNVYNVLGGAFCLLITLAVAYLLGKVMKGESRMQLLGMGSTALLLSGVVTYLPFPDSAWEYPLYPEHELRSIVRNVQLARLQNNELLDYVKALPSPAEKPSSISTVEAGQGVVLVLHIGESVRADRLSLNGYLNKGRSTTPWLDSQKGSTLINFPHCISSAWFTCPAMVTILTDARRSFQTNTNPEYDARAGSVLDLFSANHFSVYSFFYPMRGMTGKYEEVLRFLTKSSEKRIYAPGISHTVLPYIGEVVQKKENQLLFINNEGSHMPFRAYERSSAPFLPLPPDGHYDISTYAEELNNSYDNTIHYTDDFIRLVTEKLEGRPWVYVYVSDHGEYLGHDGIWFRSSPHLPEKYHHTTASRVGMFVIVSPEFEKLHPHFAEKVHNLRDHAEMVVGHEHIYHTLLGLFGITTPYYKASLDIGSDAPEPYTGPQPAATGM